MPIAPGVSEPFYGFLTPGLFYIMRFVFKAPCCLNLPVGAMGRKGKFPIWGCQGVFIPGRGQGGVFLSGHDKGCLMVWA